jgi:hypothetical protein
MAGMSASVPACAGDRIGVPFGITSLNESVNTIAFGPGGDLLAAADRVRL